MTFSFDGVVYDLEIEYDECEDDCEISFMFVNEFNRKIVMGYCPTRYGGVGLHVMISFQNGKYHGTQYGWYPIEDGGHQMYISKYQNGKLHGIQYNWYPIQDGGHQKNIKQYQNDILHGIQQYWSKEKLHYTNTY
jgi:antitoxin component YwqK of YwqJK toxin-antitoxin module